MHNFKKTVLVTLLLLLCVVLVYAAYTAPYFYGSAYYYQDGAVRSDLSGQLNMLICGSSHAFRAFIPEQIDRELGTDSYNLACSMQTMQGRYRLLKKEVERNPVNTVIMELSYNAMTRNREKEGPEGDIYELGRFTNPMDRLGYFFSAIRPSEYSELFHDTVDRSGTAWKKLIKGEMWLESVRGYLGLEPVDQTISAQERQEIYHSEKLPTVPDQNDAAYFEKCMELCRENNIRVIFVVTPITDRFLLKYEGLEAIHQLYTDYAAQYGCELYDFNLLKTNAQCYPQDTAFFDETHLSKEGAATFSADLCRVLQRAAQGEDITELFYADYDRLEQVLLAKP